MNSFKTRITVASEKSTLFQHSVVQNVAFPGNARPAPTPTLLQKKKPNKKPQRI